MRTPKENKQKLRDRTPKSTAGTIPKAALKAVWLKTKEQARTAARENDTESRQQEPTYSLIITTFFMIAKKMLYRPELEDTALVLYVMAL